VYMCLFNDIITLHFCYGTANKSINQQVTWTPVVRVCSDSNTPKSDKLTAITAG